MPGGRRGPDGRPRAILSDHAAELHGAIEIFRRQHPRTSELYDIKHKAACLLKALLEGDEHWQRYASLAAGAKVAIQQTPWACLVPPSQRSKSRFMNLSELVRWGRQTLALLDDPCRSERLPESSGPALRDKLAWLAEFRESLTAWSAYHDLIEGALDFVRCRGLYAGAGSDLAEALPAASAGAASELRERLIGFVTAESSQARAGEILPGTTEVLESCFGKLKALEDGQSKSGFTGLVLSLGAMVTTRTAEAIGEALERCRVRDVVDWCREKLGVSVQAPRRQAYAEPKCEQIRDERGDDARPTIARVRASLPASRRHHRRGPSEGRASLPASRPPQARAFRREGEPPGEPRTTGPGLQKGGRALSRSPIRMPARREARPPGSDTISGFVYQRSGTSRRAMVHGCPILIDMSSSWPMP